MNVRVYLYKRYDTDLLSLHVLGYPVSAMMKAALTAYSNSNPIFFYIDEYEYFDLNDRQSFGLNIAVSDNDIKTCTVIKNIKHGYRSNFCKTVLRNAFINQNTSCYFATNGLIQLQGLYAQGLKLSAYKNLHPISKYKGLKGITIDSDGEVNIHGMSKTVNVINRQPVFEQPISQFIEKVEPQVTIPAGVSANIQQPIILAPPSQPVTFVQPLQQPVQQSIQPIQPVQQQPIQPAPPPVYENVPTMVQPPSQNEVILQPDSNIDEGDNEITIAENDALFAAFDNL